MEKEKHIISILVEDKYGALSRIVELFSSRGFNLDSICSGESEEQGSQRLTIVCTTDKKTITRIKKLLKQLLYVYEVTNISPDKLISRELILVRIKADKENRTDLLQLVDSFQAQLIEINDKSLSFYATGDGNKINELVKVLRDYELIELARTGEAAIHR